MATDISKEKLVILDRVYNKEKNFYGRDKLYHHLKVNHPDASITVKEVMTFLKSQTNYQKNLPTVQIHHFKPIISKSPLNILQVDLQDWSNKPSMMYKYIMIVIDVFSRYVWARAMVNKTSSSTQKAFEFIVNSIEDRKNIRVVMTDDGNEFKGEFAKYLKKLNINHVSKALPQNNGVVERSNKTIKSLIWKMMQSDEDKRKPWKEYLDDVVEKYNTSLHRVIKQTPEEAFNTDNPEELYEQTKELKQAESTKRRIQTPEALLSDIEVGDRVRFRIAKSQLDKTFINNWSDSIYEVIKVTRPRKLNSVIRYKLMDPEDERPIFKTFLREELQKIV